MSNSAQFKETEMEEEIVLEAWERIPDYFTPEDFIIAIEELLLNGIINNEEAVMIWREFVGAY